MHAARRAAEREARETSGMDRHGQRRNLDVDATGGAAERAAELGVDIATVTGTGKDGRVTKADVEAAAS
jgi:pyruvate/2-oxoglutarate dehydrogenase complex dihydrolipoamide acyltransferase (E2) component